MSILIFAIILLVLVCFLGKKVYALFYKTYGVKILGGDCKKGRR